MAKDKDEMRDLFFDSFLASFDIEKIYVMFEAEYQRGRDDYRDELLAKIGVVTDATKSIEKRKPKPVSCSFPTCSDESQCAEAGECLGLLFQDPPVLAKQSVAHDQDNKSLAPQKVNGEIKVDAKISGPGHAVDNGAIVAQTSSITVSDSELIDAPDELVSQLSKKTQERHAEISAKDVSATKANRNLGGRPSNNVRPPQTPTNLAMAVEAITTIGGKATGPQIRDFVRKKWWPTAPQDWSSRLYDFVKEGKLARDGINFVMPIPVELPSVLSKEPSAVLMPPVQPTAESRPDPIPPPAPKNVKPPAQTTAMARRAPVNDCTQDEKFEWLGKSAMLKPREYMFCKKLVAVKGHHIGEQFLAESIGLRRTEERMVVLRNLVDSSNPKIAPLGIEIMYFQGFGFIARDISK